MEKLNKNDWEILNKSKNQLSVSERDEKLGKFANFHELKELLINLEFEEDRVFKFYLAFSKFPRNLTYEEEKELCKFFLKYEWHQYHEELINNFQVLYNNDIENIDYLVYLLENLPTYVAFDSALSEPFIRKVIYAIGAQPEPDNIIALERIAKSEDETIRDFALHQIEIRKKLGRWEQKINM